MEFFQNYCIQWIIISNKAVTFAQGCTSWKIRASSQKKQPTSAFVLQAFPLSKQHHVSFFFSFVDSSTFLFFTDTISFASTVRKMDEENREKGQTSVEKCETRVHHGNPSARLKFVESRNFPLACFAQNASIYLAQKSLCHDDREKVKNHVSRTSSKWFPKDIWLKSQVQTSEFRVWRKLLDFKFTRQVGSQYVRDFVN